MKISDMRKRPWKVLRVVVEVSVPPTSRATEGDLAFHVEEAIPKSLPLRRACHADAIHAAVRIKRFKSFWPAFLRKEKGLSIGRKKEKSHDPNNGL
jgi:hypothetical protein